MPLEKVLALKFDKYRPEKTIQEWINGEVRDQLFSHTPSPKTDPAKDRIPRAFAVVLIGERRVLFAEARPGDWKNKDNGNRRWTAKGIEEARYIAETEEAAEIKGE